MRRPEERAATQVPGPRSPASEEVLNPLAPLRKQFRQVQQLLEDARSAVADGRVPPAELETALQALRTRFASAHRQLAEESAFVRLHASWQGADTLSSLEALSGEIQSAGVSLNAFEALERVLGLSLEGNPDSMLLAAAKANAERLLKIDPETGSVKELADGTRPLAALLVLADEGPQLEDEEALLLSETVEETYGKRLAVAALRGRIETGPAFDASTSSEQLDVLAVSEPSEDPLQEIQYKNDAEPDLREELAELSAARASQSSVAIENALRRKELSGLSGPRFSESDSYPVIERFEEDKKPIYEVNDDFDSSGSIGDLGGFRRGGGSREAEPEPDTIFDSSPDFETLPEPEPEPEPEPDPHVPEPTARTRSVVRRRVPDPAPETPAPPRRLRPLTESSPHTAQRAGSSPDLRPRTDRSARPRRGGSSPDLRPESRTDPRRTSSSPDLRPRTQRAAKARRAGSSPDLRPETSPPRRRAGSSPDLRPESAPSRRRTGSSPDLRPETAPPRRRAGSSPDLRPETAPPRRRAGSSPDLRPETQPTSRRSARVPDLRSRTRRAPNKLGNPRVTSISRAAASKRLPGPSDSAARRVTARAEGNTASPTRAMTGRIASRSSRFLNPTSLKVMAWDSLDGCAERVLKARAGEQGSLVHGLILRLASDGQYGLAYLLAKVLEERNTPQALPMPSWLLAAMACSLHLNHPDAGLAAELKTGLSQWSAFEANHKPPLSFSLYLLAASLRPALLATSTGATELLSKLGLDPQLSELAKTVAKYGARLEGVDPATIAEVTTLASWKREYEQFLDEARSWCQETSSLTVVNPSATHIWRIWWSQDGLLSDIFEWVWGKRSEDLREAQERLSSLASAAAIEKEVNDLARRIGMKEIRGRALTRLNEHTRTALDWVQRWVKLRERRPSLRNYVQREFEALRFELKRSSRTVLSELEELSRSRRHDVAAAAACALLAAKNFFQLFENDRPFARQEPHPKHLLLADLLRLKGIELNAEWQPTQPYSELLQPLLQLVEQKADWIAAFQGRLGSKDRVGTQRILEHMRFIRGQRGTKRSARKG